MGAAELAMNAPVIIEGEVEIDPTPSRTAR